jgi:hypothetical protein
MNYYLKTTSESALWESLEAAGLAKKEYDLLDPANMMPDDYDPIAEGAEFEPAGDWSWSFTGEALDIIGTIYNETGNTLTNEDGYEYPEVEAVDGFHANLKAERGIGGLPTVEAPSTPYRKWAGE